MVKFILKQFIANPSPWQIYGNTCNSPIIKYPKTLMRKSSHFHCVTESSDRCEAVHTGMLNGPRSCWSERYQLASNGHTAVIRVEGIRNNLLYMSNEWGWPFPVASSTGFLFKGLPKLGGTTDNNVRPIFGMGVFYCSSSITLAIDPIFNPGGKNVYRTI